MADTEDTQPDLSVTSEYPVDEYIQSILDEIGYGEFQIRLYLLCAFGYFGVCAEMLVPVFISREVMDLFKIDQVTFAYMPFACNAAMFFTSLITGFLSDRWGRRIPYCLALIIIAIFGFCSAIAPNWPLFVFLRAFVGVGNGIISTIDYVIFVECSPRNKRGNFSMLIFIFGCLGVSYVAGLPLIDLKNPLLNNWQMLLIFAMLPMLVTLGLRFACSVETPQYLVSAGRIEEAHAVLFRILKENRSTATLPNLETFTERCNACARSPCKAGLRQASELLSSRKPIVMLPLLLTWFLQAVAYWGYTLFLPSFLKGAGVPNTSLVIFTMVLAEIPGGLLAAFLMEYCGRVRTLRFYMLMTALLSLISSIACYYKQVILLMVSSLGIYMFMIPIWSILFLYTPECYPANVRSLSMGVHQAVAALPGWFAPFVSGLVVKSGKPHHYMFLWTAIVLLNLIPVHILKRDVPFKREIKKEFMSKI